MRETETEKKNYESSFDERKRSGCTACMCGWRRRNKEVTGNCARGKTARRKRWKRSKTDATETSFTRSHDFADQTRQPVEVVDCSASGTHRRRRSSCCRSASTLQPSFDARAPRTFSFAPPGFRRRWNALSPACTRRRIPAHAMFRKQKGSNGARLPPLGENRFALPLRL